MAHALLTWFPLWVLVFLIHEAGHVIASLALSKPRRVWGVGWNWTGPHVILTNDIPKTEMVVSLAGPMANLTMLFLAPWFPLFAVFNLVFGYINLLPIPKSDMWNAWQRWKRI